MDAESLAVYCYSCDEFVVNDSKSGHIDILRKNLQTIKRFVCILLLSIVDTNSLKFDCYRSFIHVTYRITPESVSPRSTGTKPVGQFLVQRNNGCPLTIYKKVTVIQNNCLDVAILFWVISLPVIVFNASESVVGTEYIRVTGISEFCELFQQINQWICYLNQQFLVTHMFQLLILSHALPVQLKRQRTR